jgi:hypothetical protein
MAPLGKPRYRTNLSDDDVRVIRRRLALGESRRALAAEFHLSKGAVDRIAWRDTFAWVPDDPDMSLAVTNYSAAGFAKAQAEQTTALAKGWEASAAKLQRQLTAEPFKGQSSALDQYMKRERAEGAGGLAFKVAPQDEPTSGGSGQTGGGVGAGEAIAHQPSEAGQ